MSKLNAILKNPRVIILIAVLVLSVIAISPSPNRQGVAIRAVMANSSASTAGIQSPQTGASPMSREVVRSINNIPIESVEAYYDIVSTFTYDMTVEVLTNKQAYRLVTVPEYNVTVLGELEPVVVNRTIIENVSANGTWHLEEKEVEETIYVNKTSKEITGVADLGLSVYPAPTNNIRKGLDLAGGTRVILSPEEPLAQDDFDMLIENLKQRLNVYGLSDIIVRRADDLSGNTFVIVEIAGAKKDEVRELLSKQGKFEAKIGNESVFLGGSRDVTYVCRTGDCSGLDPYAACGRISDTSWICRFRFAITLSPAAAQRQADATQNLDVVLGSGDDNYLSQDLDLILDGKLVSSLKISDSLKGKASTDIAISGSGFGATEREAALDALQNMKELQTIMITGSLPTKLNIDQMSSISPTLGQDFVNNALFVGLLAILSVVAIVFLRYRKVSIAIPIFITLVSEVVIVMGFAALIGWNLDLAAIAGLIIVIGTSVDHQVVITDEILRGESSSYSWKDKIKKAFFIIMGAYFTTVVAMLPLIRAGAGLLRGFAITTIVGVTIGVLIARPAFAAMAEILLKE
jgi:preprotein translocase subunit SecD